MGAAASVLGRIATETLDRLPKVDATKLIQDHFPAMEKYMMSTKAGQFLADLHVNQYLPTYAKTVNAIADHENAKLDAHVNFIKAGNQGPAPKMLEPQQIHQIAADKARKMTYGQNDAVIAAAIKGIEKDPNINPLQQHFHQQRLADHMAMLLHDTKENVPVPGTSQTRSLSTVKSNITRNSENRVSLNTDAVYKAPGKLEQLVQSYGQKFMAPFIAIPHLATPLNYAYNTNIRDLGAGLIDLYKDYDGIHKLASDLGLFKSTALDAYAVRYNGRNGILANSVNPEFGEAVARYTHQPGFNSTREWTIALGFAAGKHTAERATENIFRSGGKDAAAIMQLRMMGIDPAEVLKQGGKLTKEQMERGIYKYVDNNVFLDQGLNRSFASGSGPFHRMALMYHSYITRQAQLMVKTMKYSGQRLKNPSMENAAMLAQTFTMLGVVAPSAGLGIKTLQRWGRGQWDMQETKEDFENATGQNGAVGLLSAFAQGYQHMAFFGAAADYLQAITRHSLASSMIGPLGNMVSQGVTDAIYPITRAATGHSANFKPLTRDLLEYALPMNVGKIAAHQLVPTLKEQKERDQ
jgi:hypothetical protein